MKEADTIATHKLNVMKIIIFVLVMFFSSLSPFLSPILSPFLSPILFPILSS